MHIVVLFWLENIEGPPKQKSSALFSLPLVDVRAGWPGIALIVGQRVGFLSDLPLMYREALFWVSKHAHGGQLTSKSRPDRTQRLWTPTNVPLIPQRMHLYVCVTETFHVVFVLNLLKLYLLSVLCLFKHLIHSLYVLGCIFLYRFGRIANRKSCGQ